MKAVAAALVLLAALSSAQTPTKLYGKSRAQAVAMGEQKWMDLVSDHPDGNSTHGMAQAMDFFAAGAADRNDKLIAKLPAARKKALRTARAAIMEAGFALVTCDREVNGGGTMYTLFYPSRAAGVELMIFGFIKGKDLASADSSAVTKARAKWTEAMGKTDVVEDKARFASSVADANQKIDAALNALQALKPNERAACRAKLVDWLTPETDNIGTQ